MDKHSKYNLQCLGTITTFFIVKGGKVFNTSVFLIYFIYLFIFGCFGSLLLCAGLL